MEEECKEFKLIVAHKAMVHICADTEEEAIQQWNDCSIAHAYDLEYLNEKPKFTGEIWEHDG